MYFECQSIVHGGKLAENGCTIVKRVLELIHLLGLICFVPLKLPPISFISFYFLCFQNWSKRAEKFYIVFYWAPWSIFLIHGLFCLKLIMSYVSYSAPQIFLLQGLVLQDRKSEQLYRSACSAGGTQWEVCTVEDHRTWSGGAAIHS
jgi:hypothetical protein